MSGRKIRNLKRCAATLLWGCSSGAMKEMGSFERIGTPNHYMIAGWSAFRSFLFPLLMPIRCSPSLVANLWDVTDKDLDKFTEGTFAKLGLNFEKVSECYKSRGSPSREHNHVSITAAVAQSRKTCKMEYLVGASPVVYGIPFYV
jgi:separase